MKMKINNVFVKNLENLRRNANQHYALAELARREQADPRRAAEHMTLARKYEAQISALRASLRQQA